MLAGFSAFAQKSYNFKKAESEARQLLHTAPDSALVIINTTLAQKKPIHDTILGNTYSLYGIYYAMGGKPDSSIYYFKKGLNHVNNYTENKKRILSNLAIAYRQKGKYKESINHLNEVIAISKQQKDSSRLALVYGELASNYNYMQQYDKSVYYLLKAIALLNNKNDLDKIAGLKQKLANAYLAMENFDFAIDLYQEALSIFKEIKSDKNYYLTLVNLGETYIRIKDYNAALKYLSEGVSGLEKFGDKEILGIAYNKLGNIQRKKGDIKKALSYYQKAYNYLTTTNSVRVLRIAGEYIKLLNDTQNYQKALQIIKETDPYRKSIESNVDDRMVYVMAIAETYNKTNQLKEAVKQYKTAITLVDSSSFNETERKTKELQAKFQTKLQREKNIALKANNDALKNKVEAEERLILFYIIGSIALFLIVLAFLRTYWLRSNLQKEQLKNTEAEKSLIEQQHQHEQELNNNQRKAIEEKKRELTATTMQMANLQDSINQIINKCSDNKITLQEIKKELEVLNKKKDYWKQFKTRFNNLHPEFEKKLSSEFPELTKNDIEFCSLLKLNLSYKEIASMLQISYESTITKKYRIKKKIGIKDDKEFEKLLLNL
ncbi:hypothetical protein GCM10007424_18910 [Flavobacterium suaedae]|uniref:Tetratricopeptide repeat protein n=2 Tax=Flavobacterium suaedae TaxID=1767027 RepID=A0ABQ1JW65_9FLAO|nr:hypothetical protein GCM10007424_18910 [Flavobacterium suaedae]